jgi:hypothetical protein
MPAVTRRTFLVAATGVLAVKPALAGAAGPTPAPTPAPSPTSTPAPTPVPNHAHARQGSIDIDVRMEFEQDVARIAYTVTNVGTVKDTYTVWHVDQFNQRASKQRTLHLAPGATKSIELHGHILHAFVVHACSSDGTCLSLGPVALVPFPKTRPPQPTPTPATTPAQAPAATG